MDAKYGLKRVQRDVMETLTQIPFSLDVKQIEVQSHVAAGSSDAEDLRLLIELAKEVGKPKAAYAVCFIGDRDGDTVQIGNIRFQSQTLVHKLKSVERVFPLVATCGHELDEAFPGKDDMLKKFSWELIKTRMLDVANKHLTDHLHRKFRLGKTASRQKGSADEF